MHDGTTTYQGVIEVVQKLRQHGKTLIILSNSSKRQDNSIKMLTKLGFDNATTDLFAQIITSGEVTHYLLSGITPDDHSPLAPQPWPALASIIGSFNV